MRYVDSIFGSLLKPINRRWFQAVVDRHDADAYDKSFKSWDHLVTLMFAQLSGVDSLRGLELAFNANAQAHYHLGVSEIARATVSDANARRPTEPFAELVTMLSTSADRASRREGAAMVTLIDASPIPLGKLCQWAKWNGRIRGLKLHVVYDPQVDIPRCVEITPANVNDVEVGCHTPIVAGTTYVFDKAYCHFGWWRKINDDGAFFVTRAKVNMRLRATGWRSREPIAGDGCTIIDDATVLLASKGNARLPIPLRRIRLRRDKGGMITLITNDLTRTAVEIAALYKSRWQIELLFRWIKQHLRIRKFLGKSENAIRLQILAAMIAYLLLRIIARLHRLTMPALRLAELVCQRLFLRRPLAQIDKPPPVNPSRRQLSQSPGQLEFCYV
jgi:IS4 transposase